VSFFYLVPIFQKDVLYYLLSAAALALVSISLINSVEVGTKADLTRTHLCDHGTDRSICVFMDFKCVFSRLDAEPIELSTMFRAFLG
jgi:hypothetical protein